MKKNVAEAIEKLFEVLLAQKKKVMIGGVGVLILAAAVSLFLKAGGGGTGGEGVSIKTSEASADAGKKTEAEEAPAIYIDISGAVNNPGVYSLREGDRIFNAIEKAGGLAKNADVSELNRAQALSDGEKIYVPKKGESSAGGSASAAAGSAAASQNEKVNINQADMTELQTLNGVGPATAQKIIDYRTQNGRFKTIEDIKNVSGIGDKTFEKLAPYIST